MFTLIGAFLGGSIFGPLGVFVGASVGSMIDFALWNPKSQAGKPLESINISQSIEGQPIKYIYGTARTGMHYVWISPLKKRPLNQKVEQSSFFGFWKDTKNVQVGWQYYGSFVAIACHGPIEGISRIWNNDTGELVYDKRVDVTDEIAADSDKWASRYNLKILRGTTDQSRIEWMREEIDEALDSGHESSGGIAEWIDVPEYKGYAGIAVRNIDFPNGRMPNLSVEVVNAGYVEPSTWEEITPQGTYWDARSMAGVAVIEHKNTTKVFVAGGWDTGTSYHNDLWVSEDMRHWKRLANLPMNSDHKGYGRFQFDMWGFYISEDTRVTIDADPALSLSDSISEGNYLYVMGGATKNGEDADIENVGPIIYKTDSNGAVTKWITGYVYNIDRDSWAPIIVHAGGGGDEYGTYQNVVPWPRYAYASVVYGGYVYISGGAVSDSDDYHADFLTANAKNGWFGDTWRSSTGGLTWEKVGSTSTFEWRRSHYMIVHKGALYLCGGTSYHPDMANPVSERANAFYKLVNGQWDQININVSAITCTSIVVVSGTYTVTLENTDDIDYSELLTVGHEFKLYDSTTHPMTGYGRYEIGDVQKSESGVYTNITVAAGDQATFESETDGIAFGGGWFECALFQDEVAGGSLSYGNVWGMAEHGNGIVVLIAIGDVIYAAKSTNEGKYFEELDLQGSIPEYASATSYPEFNVINFYDTVYTLGGEDLGTGLLDEIWRIDTPLLGQNAVYLDDVVTDICTRRGLSTSQIDVTDLDGIIVKGFVSEDLDGGEELNHLRRVYRFDYWEEDGKIVFKRRNRTSDVTIPEDDLAVREKTNEYTDKLNIDNGHELQLPMQIRMQYIDAARDYQTGSQISKRIITDSFDDRVTIANKIQDIQVPIVMTSSQALQAATEILWDLWNARRTVEFTVSTKYLEYDPGTISTINNGDEQYVVKWRKIDLSTPGLIKVGGAITDLNLYDPDLTGVDSDGDTNRQGSGTVINISDTNYVFLDIPIIHSGIDDFGFYVAATPSNTENWAGAEVYLSRNSGDDYELIAEIQDASIIGETENSFDKKTCFGWDLETEITVKLMHKTTLTSADPSEVMAGKNLFAIGDEIIGVANVEFLGYIEDSSGASNSYSRYKFTKLARGLFGTEYQRVSHLVAGEDVVLLSNLSRIPLEPSDQSVELTYKVVTKGQKLANTDEISFTCDSEGRRLPSPAGVDAMRHMDGSWEIWWNRRVRVFDVFDPFDFVDRTDDLYGFLIILYNSDGDLFLSSQPTYQIDASEPRIKLDQDDIYYSLPLKEFQVRVHQLSKTHGLSHPVQAKINFNGAYQQDHPNFLTDSSNVF